MANNNVMYGLPFANLSEKIMLDDQQNNDDKTNYLHSTNNDMLADIDPDINNMNPNGLQKQCRYYDTSLEFNKTVDYVNNISILHTNICSSINKLIDFMYYIDNLDTTFHFIGLSEHGLLTIIKTYSVYRDIHTNNVYALITREGEALVSIFITKYSIKLGMIWLFPKKYSSLFLLRWINRFSTPIEM